MALRLSHCACFFFLLSNFLGWALDQRFSDEGFFKDELNLDFPGWEEVRAGDFAAQLLMVAQVL